MNRALLIAIVLLALLALSHYLVKADRRLFAVRALFRRRYYRKLDALHDAPRCYRYH